MYHLTLYHSNHLSNAHYPSKKLPEDSSINFYLLAMESQRQHNPTAEPTCTKASCFFCTMINEPDPSIRRVKISKFFKEMPLRDDQEHILALSGLWRIAMTQTDDPEFPSLGIFECMAKLIRKSINDRDWLLKGQNIYIPYYAAHIVGSYTMSKVQFAEKAVKSGVILPLMELLRGKISWVEQRVAVRALCHLASHEKTFEAIAVHEMELVELAMKIASTCLNEVYDKFIGVRDSKRLKYHSELLTRGLGVLEIENRKAEEWATQLQCWSLYLLNCFACKERSLSLICNNKFLQDLCGMWGGLAYRSSPAGIGLIRTLCQTKTGRRSVSDLKQIMQSICSLSRSSDDWQYTAIDCLLLILKDSETRYNAMDIAAPVLVDLVELGGTGGRSKVGDTITQAILKDYHMIKYGNLKLKSKRAEQALGEIWDLKVERKKREKLMSNQEVGERKLLACKLKKDGNQRFWSGDIEKAVMKYSEALNSCPLRMRKERVVLYSNRAQCHLLLRNPEAAISDATRALCLSSAANPHGKSLWRRSQAYDMEGLGRESLMDCLAFVSDCLNSENSNKRTKIPYYAGRMINKQMNATWIFSSAKLKRYNQHKGKVEESDDHRQVDHVIKMMKMKRKEKGGPGKSFT
jgi:tetratricopeptide (TPR) repeat protein